MDKDAHFKCGTSNLKNYYCIYCDFKTNFTISICDHFQKLHAKNKKNTFASISLERYKCKNCNFFTYSLLRLFKHTLSCQENIKRKKQSITKYQCPYCPRKIAHSYYCLKQHLIRIHTAPEEIKWYKCDQCDYRGKVKENLKNHLKIHKPDNEVSLFYCNQCEYKSTRKYDVQKHTFEKHTPRENMAKYECNICNYKTVIKRNLKQHIFLRHTAPEEIHWYQCEHCTYRSKVKWALTRHEKIHRKSAKT